jgi:hypothetical protein
MVSNQNNISNTVKAAKRIRHQVLPLKSVADPQAKASKVRMAMIRFLLAAALAPRLLAAGLA